MNQRFIFYSGLDKELQECYTILCSVRLQVMLLFAIPVCDLCKATARYGKETGMLVEHLSVMNATGKSVGSLKRTLKNR